MIVWLKCCSNTVSVIFRFGKQEGWLFPVFPSPQNLGYLRQGEENPELVYQLELNNVSMFPDLLCGRGSGAATVTLQHSDSIFSFETTQRHQVSQLK